MHSLFQFIANIPRWVKILSLAWCFVLLLVGVYGNHFDNGFYFDDSHTILNNTYIRDLDNTVKFFTDLETFGTMPNNRTHRPMVTLLNAIDYHWGGGYNSMYFHISIFFWYLVQLVLMFFFFRKLFNITAPRFQTAWIAFLSVVFYAFHTANAETLNYIIMRSDSFSTLCIILAFVVHQNTRGIGRYFWPIIPMLIGLNAKETGLMFVPLFYVYVLLFELNHDKKKWWSGPFVMDYVYAFLYTLPYLVVGLGYFIFQRQYFRPDESVFVATKASAITYFITQWRVIAHYIANFIFPVHLSADPDTQLSGDILNHETLFSLSLLLILFGIAVVNMRVKRRQPIAFGILWFFIALAPTSSIVPFGQVSNDHRTFFPYLGLVLALGWYIGLLLHKYADRIKTMKWVPYALVVVYLGIIGAHSYGIRQRNEVWNDSDSLWYDVTIKSPKNARGLMNYALGLMRQGKFEETQDYFNRAMELWPNYSYLHINMGVLKSAMGQNDEAEHFYTNAIRLDYTNVEAYYYYADFLYRQSRYPEAMEMMNKAYATSPGYGKLEGLMNKLEAVLASGDQSSPPAQAPVRNPEVDRLINLSLDYYNEGKYEQCIHACEMALIVNPNSAEAYNNMCCAYNKLQQWDKGVEACQKALQINPAYQLARNNLNWAQEGKRKADLNTQ